VLDDHDRPRNRSANKTGKEHNKNNQIKTAATEHVSSYSWHPALPAFSARAVTATRPTGGPVSPAGQPGERILRDRGPKRGGTSNY
jgi:hypothetical protein